MAEEAVRVLSNTPMMTSLRVGGVYAVRWRQVPTVELVRTVQRQVETESASNSKLIYCGISDSGVGDNHSDELKQALLKGTGEMLKRCAEFNIVMAGNTIGARMIRSMYRALVTSVRVTGKVMQMDISAHVHKVEIHESTQSFFKKMDERNRSEAMMLRRVFAQHSMLEDT